MTQYKCGCTRNIENDEVVIDYCLQHSPNGKIHKAVRNVLNEMGIDREYIKRVVEERIDKYLKDLFDSNYSGFKDKMLGYVSDILSDKKGYRYKNIDHGRIEKFISNEISTVIKELLLSKLDVNIKVK